MSSTTTPLPFQTPAIKNAKVIKLELNPFLQNILSHYTQPLPFENEPHTIETIPLIREHLDTYLFYIRYKVLTITEEYPTFQISFPQQKFNSSHIYRRTINPINLQVPIKQVFHAFLNNVKDHNLAHEIETHIEPHTIETIPLIREHLDTYLFYIRYKVLTITEEYPTFQISFPQQKFNSSHIYRRTINPINLQVPIKQVFHAFLNNVKDHNLAHEIPKYSPNALDDLQRYIDNFDVEIIETLVNPEDNPHHWLQADILRIQNFIYHYFKDLTLNDQTIPQIKVISLFLRKYFRFNYQLLWSQQDQSAFTEFPDQFTSEECLPFIISEQNEHPYFHKPQKITKQTLDYIRFDPLLITENDLFPDNRPYHYQQNSQDQQNLHFNTNNSTEDNNTDQENTTQQQNQPENYNDNEFTTKESTISTYNPSQTETSTSVHTHSFRVPTRVINQGQNIHSPQSHLDTSPNRNITFNFPHTDDINDETHDTLQYTSSTQNTSANVASPTRTTSDSTRYITRARYDPPSIPSAFRSNRSTISSNNFNDNPQTSNRYYDPFNYNFYPPSNTTTNTNINQNNSQINTISTTQNPFIQLSNTNTSQNIYSQNRGTSCTSISYSNITQDSQRRLHNPPLTHIPTDPLYQTHSI